MYNYVGPTWAQRSFDLPGVEETNFAKVWTLPHNNYLFPTKPPGYIADRVQQLNLSQPIVWVYSDPWGDIPRLTGCSHREYVTRQDWFDIWREANQKILQKINNLGLPVFIIGTHCDVIDCEFSNITVGHPSWQYYMAEQLGLVKNQQIVIENRIIKHCVAQEIYFKFFHENPDLKPDTMLKDLIIDQWMLWDQFHKNNLMYDHHPTGASYTQFANHLKPKLLKWLN